MEENKALENRQSKTIKRDNDSKEQIKEALKESKNLNTKPDEKPQRVKKINLKKLFKRMGDNKHEITIVKSQ